MEGCTDTDEFVFLVEEHTASLAACRTVIDEEVGGDFLTGVSLERNELSDFPFELRENSYFLTDDWRQFMITPSGSAFLLRNGLSYFIERIRGDERLGGFALHE
jgi:hypothetical protein